MKNFTFFLSLLLISATASSQNKKEFYQQIQQKYAKFERLTKQNKNIVGTSDLMLKSELNSDVFKNVTASVKLDSVVSQVINRETDLWVNDWKDVYIYDLEFKNTEIQENEWNAESQSWKTWSKTKVIYNDAGQVFEMLFYNVQDESPGFKLESRLMAFYNNLGKPDSVLFYSPLTEMVSELTSKQVYHYDTEGRLIKLDLWEMQGMEGEEDVNLAMSSVYTYNSSGQLENKKVFMIMEDEEMLFSETVIYTENNVRITENSGLSFISFQFEKNNKTETHFNNFGISQEVYSVWSSNTNNWIEQHKYEYQYNEVDWYTSVIYPTYQNLFFGMEEESTEFWGRVISSVSTFDMINGNWQIDERTFLHYSESTSTNVQDIEKYKVSIYPNPATESVRIGTAEIQGNIDFQIYSVSGTKVFDKLVNSGEPVSVAHLKNGMYMYKLINRGQLIKSGKLVIQ